MTIGENIKRIRIEEKLTQKKLGELSGMSEAMIRQYELGYRKPKLESVQKIADALNIRLHDLIEDEKLYSPKEYADEFARIAENAHTPSTAEIRGLRLLAEPKRAEIDDLMDQLNAPGQDKAVEQVELLTKIPEYQKSPEGPGKDRKNPEED